MTERRYPAGQNPIYDRQFDRLVGASHYLHPERHKIAWGTLQTHDVNSLTITVREVRAKCQRADQVVADLDSLFEQLKLNRRNQGKSVPAERDTDAQREYLEACALADVKRAELDFLVRRLANFESNKPASILPHGPVGSGKVGQGTLALLDGQKVFKNSSGELVIDCPASPYHKMKVADYREFVVGPWLRRRRPDGKRIPRWTACAPENLPAWPSEVPKPDAEPDAPAEPIRRSPRHGAQQPPAA